MSQYHCPTCSEIYYNDETPLWSIGKIYCARHKKYDPTIIAWLEGAKALDEWFARVAKERNEKA
jgi:hypothetical protein